MKDYAENKKLSFPKYWDVNDLYGWTISKKLFVHGFKQVENTYQFKKDFIKNYKEDSDEGYFLEVDLQYIEKLHDLHNYLLFLPGRMRTEKLVANLHDKK